MATDLGTSSPKMMVMKVTTTKPTMAAQVWLIARSKIRVNAEAPSQPSPRLATVTPS